MKKALRWIRVSAISDPIHKSFVDVTRDAILYIELTPNHLICSEARNIFDFNVEASVSPVVSFRSISEEELCEDRIEISLTMKIKSSAFIIFLLFKDCRKRVDLLSIKISDRNFSEQREKESDDIRWILDISVIRVPRSEHISAAVKSDLRIPHVIREIDIRPSSVFVNNSILSRIDEDVVRVDFSN